MADAGSWVRLYLVNGSHWDIQTQQGGYVRDALKRYMLPETPNEVLDLTATGGNTISVKVSDIALVVDSTPDSRRREVERAGAVNTEQKRLYQQNGLPWDEDDDEPWRQ
jgi:hypothetical protein